MKGRGAAGSAGGCRLLQAALLGALLGVPAAQAQDAASLKAQYVTLREQLGNNQFHRPLYLKSREKSGGLKGDIYALIEQPYELVGPALRGTGRWCDILILHLNVKRCRASSEKNGDHLSLSVGRKFDQPLADTYLLVFSYRVTVDRSDYLQVVLNAKEGPMGTSRYRIVLEVVEVEGRRSFLHMSYSNVYNVTARMALQVYLATIGRDKVGFSIVGTNEQGGPVYIGSLRGMVERNSMRSYLAIEAYLDALSAPVTQQLEQRLNGWYEAVERYPAQLHEMERDEYLAMKRKEVLAQQGSGTVAVAKSESAAPE